MTSTPENSTTRQAVATAYGEPEKVIEIIEIPTPAPGPGEALITVEAIGTNPFDTKTIRGLFGADTSQLPRHPGLELAGVITELGSPTDGFAVGDPVIAYPAPGAFADHVVVSTGALHPRPAELSPEIGAGLLLAGVTAADAVRTAEIGGDDVVVVHGGAGAVGVIVVQLAITAGATVIATAAEANHDHLRSLGAIPIRYGEGLLDRIREAAPGPVTRAIDAAGTDEAIDVSLQLLPAAAVVSVAAFGRGSDGIVIVDGSTPESRRHRAEAASDLIAAAASGSLVVEVAARYPLAQAGVALSELGRTHQRGKFIVIP